MCTDQVLSPDLQSRVPPESPQLTRKSRVRPSKSLCLQREAPTSRSAVNRRLVDSSRNWTKVASRQLRLLRKGFTPRALGTVEGPDHGSRRQIWGASDP